MRNTRWIAKVLGIILAILIIWFASALLLGVAFAEGYPFSMTLRSNLRADYGQEGADLSFGSIRLSIFREVLTDLGLDADDVDEKAREYIASLDDPVPTATALDFAGNAPHTATPTETGMPTATPVPSATPTQTRVPTKVVSKTSTVKPVGTLAPVDSANPVIADPGTITPTPGPLATCSRTISVSNVNIKDAAFSSGIKWVKLKYKVYDDAEATVYAGYIFSAPLTKCSGGGTPGGGWDACYDGPSGGFNISIYPGFSALTDYTGPGPFKAKVWLITEDNAGNSASHYYGAYEMPNTCDDPPPPTDTPVPTDTTPPTILTFDVSPTPGSVLSSCVVTLNDLQIYDPAFSMGVSASGVAFGNERPTVGGVDYVQPAPGVSGILSPGNDWSGGASGSITLSGLQPLDTFDVYGVVTDISGNGPVYTSHITYSMDSVTNCP